MPRPRKKRSARDKAFNTLRLDDSGRKADALFVCRLFCNDQGAWESEGSFRHWIKNLPESERNCLPAGVPGAVIAAISSKPIEKHVGKLLKKAASNILTPHVGEGAVEMIGDLIDNFTKD